MEACSQEGRWPDERAGSGTARAAAQTAAAAAAAGKKNKVSQECTSNSSRDSPNCWVVTLARKPAVRGGGWQGRSVGFHCTQQGQLLGCCAAHAAVLTARSAAQALACSACTLPIL